VGTYSAKVIETRGKRQEASKRQEARCERQKARGKRQEARGERQEAGGKRQEARGTYSAKVLVPMKWYRVWPLQVKREVPSGISPLPY
jgi:hypothetical protein